MLFYAHVWKDSHVGDEMQNVVPDPNVSGLITNGAPQLSGVLVGIQPNLEHIVDQSQNCNPKRQFCKIGWPLFNWAYLGLTEKWQRKGWRNHIVSQARCIRQTNVGELLLPTGEESNLDEMSKNLQKHTILMKYLVIPFPSLQIRHISRVFVQHPGANPILHFPLKKSKAGWRKDIFQQGKLTGKVALQSLMQFDEISCKCQAWSTTRKRSQQDHTGLVSVWNVKWTINHFKTFT